MQKQYKNEVRRRQIEMMKAREREFILTSPIYPSKTTKKRNKFAKDDQNTEKIKTQGILGMIPINTQNYSNAKHA